MYNAIKRLTTWFFRLLFRWRVHGAEMVPASGGVIICCNHISWWDPPILGCSISRPISYMAKEELFKIPVFGRILIWLKAFPVRRHAADRSALKKSLDLLARGEVFGILPEGTRSKTGELGRAEPGTAWIAHKARVPIVPAAIITDYRLGGPVTVRFGRPIRLWEELPAKPGTEDYDRASQLVMIAIRELLNQGH